MSIRMEQVQRQTQKMIMSPQMQQAIHMLQLPMMDLAALIQQEITANPVLEETPPLETNEPQEDKTENNNEELGFDEEFSRLANVDDEWREYYSQVGSYRRISDDEEKRRRYYEESITTQETLHEHLLNQWNLTVQQGPHRSIGEVIIGNLDENGFLPLSLEDLAQSTQLPVQELEKALKHIQTFHPVGVGARNLSECLSIQLMRLGKAGSLENLMVLQHLDELGKKNYNAIAKAMGRDIQDIRIAADFISTLEPKPGRLFNQERTQFALPDVFVEKVDDAYVVSLNDDRLPHLRISQLYRSLMSGQGLEKETRDYIKNKVQAGKWLIRNIELRKQTIFNITTTIVEEQKGFLDNGIAFLKPLTMQSVATKIGVHESTISRAISGKYMMTPRGLFQIKYFFSTGLETQSGVDVSTTNVKDMLQEIISNENTKTPLSDHEMVEIFKTKGIKLARRTITKYRKELKILPSSMRRKA